MPRTEPTSSKPRRAAMYVRMSTEHQQYSIANQSEAIEQYAAEHNTTVVKRFVDTGRSGLTLRGRPALRQLLLEVLAEHANFDQILVYDVSRWGRFQDPDEGAYYEYLCRRANVALHYCVEQFSNDLSAYSSLIKALKRTMAGEYSRELSVKTFQGHSRLALMGYRQGGSPGYGLRRRVVDAKGNAKGLLRPGERKTLQTDRIVLVPGPEKEVSVLREIFKLFAGEHKSEQAIADLLNRRKVRPESNLHFPNPRWTRDRVHQILTNPKYLGTNVYNRKSTKLGQKAVMNPQEQWIHKEAAFRQIIPAKLYLQAQKIAKSRCEVMTDDEILGHLRRLLKETGRLTTRIIKQDDTAPCLNTILRRFGSFVAACRRIGYEPERDYRVNGINHYGRVRIYGTKSLADEMREAVVSGRLPETFSIPVLKAACPGWADDSYKAFVAHYSPAGTRTSAKLTRVDRGTYRLNSD